MPTRSPQVSPKCSRTAPPSSWNRGTRDRGAGCGADKRMKLKPVTSSRSIRLEDRDARVRGAGEDDDRTVRAVDRQVQRISELQRVLYADARYALLIVLQGRDAAGKDGTIRRVFTAINPQGCAVASFKAPTDLERPHDFLWRVHQQI